MIKIKVTKLDAAKRQLETAIKLYFDNLDPISIHTLAMASHGILSDLNKKYDGKPMIVGVFYIPEKYKKQVQEIINRARNHFKHADRDPESTIDFNPATNEIIIYEACVKYYELTREVVPYLNIFTYWFVAQHIEIPFGLTTEQIRIIQDLRTQYGDNKDLYFAEMLTGSGKLI